MCRWKVLKCHASKMMKCSSNEIWGIRRHLFLKTVGKLPKKFQNNLFLIIFLTNFKKMLSKKKNKWLSITYLISLFVKTSDFQEYNLFENISSSFASQPLLLFLDLKQKLKIFFSIFFLDDQQRPLLRVVAPYKSLVCG